MKFAPILLAASLLATAAPAFAADTYTLDPKHTSITWSINHLGFSTHEGKFVLPQGTLTLDEANPAASSVTVTFPLVNIVTGLPDLDEHLKGRDFFDITHYPTAIFTSTKVDVTGKNTANVTGTLTLHGITKPIVLNVRLNKLAPNMMKKQTAGFDASTVIKRSDFGINSYLPMLGDEVTIAIQCEANK